MSKTLVLRCLCSHPYQDKTYGTGMRVHNEGKSKTPGAKPPYTCTVCGNRKT